MHTISRQMYFSLMLEAGVAGTESLQIVQDVSATFEKKMDAVKCYATQFPPAKSYVFEKIEAIARIRGIAAGFQYGEAFTSTKAIGSTDLFKTLQV